SWGDERQFTCPHTPPQGTGDARFPGLVPVYWEGRSPHHAQLILPLIQCLKLPCHPDRAVRPSAAVSHELPRAPTSSHELPRAPTSSHELPRVEPYCSVRAGRPRVATAQRSAPVYQHEERRGDEPLMSPPRVMPPLYQTTQPVLKSYRGV